MTFRCYRESFRRRGYTTCHYCKIELDFEGCSNGKSFATIDHKYPSVKGGRSHEDNFVLACRLCNSIKSDQYSYEEFSELVKSPSDIDTIRKLNMKRQKERKESSLFHVRKQKIAFAIAYIYTLNGINMNEVFV